ncbi:unnamed protein product [Lactuca saligna]|uniref:Ubiquitin-like protease family profile domain-containing protein n=1 Tax=Lactuca saligna TaxID=75948 RepID=A0AA35Z293_LACSI|nr:unnamed protein product [Lactuca saligna]
MVERQVGIENVADEEEYNQFDELPPFSIGIPSTNIDIDDTAYLRSDHNEGLWIAKKRKRKARKAYNGSTTKEKKKCDTDKGKPKNKGDLEIEFDELGQNIGETQSQFSNYCGVMVRTRISILILRWDEVPKAEIDELWLNIKSWKAYKSRLVNDYLKKGRNPVPEYPYLDEPTWNAFVQLKTSPSFQEVSNKATTTAKLNKYPPRIGSRGYRGIYSLPTDLYSLVSELIEKDTQLSHGDWFPGPGADVLTEEKMKIEVEAMMEAKMEAKIEEMNAQMEEMKTYMQQFLSKNEGMHITSPVLKKNSVVSTVSDELDGIKTPTACELVIPYETMNQKCAKGMVFPYGNGQIHSVPLNANHFRVSIDKIYDQYDCIPLPVSTEEASKLCEALHGIVQWPRNAIKIIHSSQFKPNVEQDKRCSSLPVTIDPGVMKKTKPAKESLIPHNSNKQVDLEKMPLLMKRMYRCLMNRDAPDDAIYVEAEPGILGAQKIETYIYPKEILRLLNKQWLDISVITWFQIMLHSMLETRGGNKVNICAFISPSETQATICESNGEGVVSYIVDAMCFHKDKQFFVSPYWQGLHWMLLVICPNQGTGYILDSQINPDKKLVESYIIVKYVEEAVARLKEDIDTHPMKWTLVEVKVLHGYLELASC